MHIHTGNRILLIRPLCIRDPLHARTYITIEDGLHVHQKNTKLLVFLEASTSSQKAWSNFSVVFCHRYFPATTANATWIIKAADGFSCSNVDSESLERMLLWPSTISARELTRLREAIKWNLSFVFCWINHNESTTLCADLPDAYKIFDIWKTWEYLETRGIEKRILLRIILSNEWHRVTHRQEKT